MYNKSAGKRLKRELEEFSINPLSFSVTISEPALIKSAGDSSLFSLLSLQSTAKNEKSAFAQVCLKSNTHCSKSIAAV